jgi:hypothetical protein
MFKVKHIGVCDVRYQIRLDPERLTYLSSIRVDGGDGCISYHMVVEHLSGRRLERNEEICALKFCGISRK